MSFMGMVLKEKARTVEFVIASQRVGAEHRPMTGSAKQSTVQQARMDCFVAMLLAMTVEKRARARSSG
jgi:hypothetical protein